MPETLTRTALGRLELGGRVNLERAVRADGRLDGHLVQGHVDGVGALLSRTPGERWDDLAFGCPPALTRYVAEKGSIAVSGVSLTVTWVAAAVLRRLAHPDDARPHDARWAGGRRPGQPGGRRDRQVRRAAARRRRRADRRGCGMTASSGLDPVALGTVEEALDALRQGRPVLVADSADRENEVDAVIAARTATTEWVAWIIRNSSGYLCAPMPGVTGRRAGAAADGAGQPGPAPHRVHRHRRRGLRRDHRHLGCGPRQDPAGARGPRRPARPT